MCVQHVAFDGELLHSVLDWEHPMPESAGQRTTLLVNTWLSGLNQRPQDELACRVTDWLR